MIFKKNNAEQYYFLDNPWFTMTLCESTGTVDVQSDHGDWQYRWHSHGCESVKHFLAKASFNYIKGKLGYPSSGRGQAGKWFDSDATMKRIEEDVKNIGSERLMMAFEDIEDDDYQTVNELFHVLSEDILETVYENDFTNVPIVTGVHPQLKMFMEKCWPRFIQVLKEELRLNEVIC